MNNYFSHDSNARNSEKMIKVRMKYGAEGYGVYFMILERLRDEANYMSIKDYNVIAFDLRVDASIIKAVVEDFGLFVFTDDGKYFYSSKFKHKSHIKTRIRKRMYSINVRAWMKLRKQVFQRDDYTCRYCGKRGGLLEADHVIPFSKGGSDDISNLVTACRRCNRQKRDKSVAEFEDWLKEGRGNSGTTN